MLMTKLIENVGKFAKHTTEANNAILKAIPSWVYEEDMQNEIIGNKDLPKIMEEMFRKIFPKVETIKSAITNEVKETSHLRLISGGKNPKISACTGGPRASLAYASKSFPAHLDNDFKNWKLDTAQPATLETEAEVWEMHAKDGTFKEIFNSFNVDLKKLKFDSQEQIEKFCLENSSWLRTDGCGTFFLFEEEVEKKKEFFVADVYFSDDGRLLLNVDRLSYYSVWCASGRHRFVVPATFRLNS